MYGYIIKPKLQEENKTTSSTVIKPRELTENKNPTPFHFEKFLPWLCLQIHVSILVTVERMTKEDCTFSGSHKASFTRSRSKESTIATEIFDLTKAKDNINCSSSLPSSSGTNKSVNIKSYYNEHNQLVEVAIIDSNVEINRKIIQAIYLCLPFHEFLKKFVIKGRGLTEAALYEIGKLLPHSNITDVCLDDTYLPEGNYYVLLGTMNHLQNISLCRCKINDKVCKTIADNLDFETPASKTLLTIDLTSNRITNLGASYLGFMLRKNRSLLHLNLSDNIISDTGASHILRSLMLFSLTDDEIYELRKRKFKYAAVKLEECIKCEKVLRDHLKSEEDKENYQPNPGKGSNSKTVKPVYDKTSLKVQAEKKAIENIGKFSDIFDNDNINYKNDKLHCIGNLKLCYLNLSYNEMKYNSVENLCEVLKYQSSLNSKCKGLLRVVIDGNDLPVGDVLLENIQSYLKKAIKKYLLSKELNRSPPCLGRRGQKKRINSAT